MNEWDALIELTVPRKIIMMMTRKMRRGRQEGEKELDFLKNSRFMKEEVAVMSKEEKVGR